MTFRPHLEVVIASTRPGRVGEAIGQWFLERARADGRYRVGVSDLAELALPFMDEPNPPRLRQYVHEHTRRWSATVERADGFVFVVPEYNHGFCASIKNALDYLHEEWAFKPVGFVSYGGVSAGMRGVQMLKPVLTALRMIPLNDQVAVANFAQYLREDAFQPAEIAELASTALLDDMRRTLDTLGRLGTRVA